MGKQTVFEEREITKSEQVAICDFAGVEQSLDETVTLVKNPEIGIHGNAKSDGEIHVSQIVYNAFKEEHE